MWKPIFAISCGASLGALLRWWFGIKLNSYFPSIPPGTLTANLVGGYIIGAASVFFATMAATAPEWRLFVITGFCGGLTTFSTFSVEVSSLIQGNRHLWALGAIFIHVLGSLATTFLGILSMLWVNGWLRPDR